MNLLHGYRKFLIPMWLFPFYLVGWGIACHSLQIQALIPLFVVTVAPILVGAFFWSLGSWAYLSYPKYVLFALIVPFLTFCCLGGILALAQGLLR